MLSAIRSRITYVNVVATLVLVFAMTGGAYAAKKYLITSTKQISPSVLKSLKGANGVAGAQGPQGPAGPGGPAGPVGGQGAKGETGVAGKEGPQGKDGATGAKGANGAAGSTGPMGATGQTGFTATLPSGQTETGAWSFAGFFKAPGAGGVIGTTISFPIQLASPLEESHVREVEFGSASEIEIGEEEGGIVFNVLPKEKCKGTVASPTAAAGYLCVYLGESLGLSSPLATIYVLDGEFNTVGAGKTGAQLRFGHTGEGSAHGAGSFAVTAP